MVAAGRPDGRGGRDGFALVEVMIGLLLIALLAAIAMPGLARSTGSGTLRIAAMQISALLRDERNAALRTGRATSALVDGGGASVRSRSSRAFVAMPTGSVAAPRGMQVRFDPDGRASGGPITLVSAHARFSVAVSPDSGAIGVSSP